MSQEQNTLDQFGLHLKCELVAKAMCGDIGPVEEFSEHCGENGCLAQSILNGNIFNLMLSTRIRALNKMNAKFNQNNAPHGYFSDAPTEVRATVCGAVCGEHCPSLTEDQRKILFVYNGPEE